MRIFFNLPLPAGFCIVLRNRNGVAAMVYTIKEIRLMLADRPLPEIARQSGIAHTTLWRLLSGRQEARETTLVKLTAYVNKAMQNG